MTPRTGSAGLDLLTAQLWARPVAEGWARVAVEPVWRRAAPAEAGWEDVETYWAVPDVRRVRLLVPADGSEVAAPALWHYRRLRRPREAAFRTALGAAARVRLPVGAQRVRVQRRTDSAADLPLAIVAAALGIPVRASIGIRPGINGKPTLQLVGPSGEPAGYAKLGWNDHTDDYVLTETRVLQELDGGALVRTPRVLATGTAAAHPWVVTAPLPADARALRPGDPGPTPQELAGLAPVVASRPAGSTEQWQGVRARMVALGEVVPPEVRTAADAVVALVNARDHPVPVTQRWHGDLTPWNCARDRVGTLWCWDWETSEDDAPAGLDALHWSVSVARGGRHGIVGVSLQACLEDAAPQFQALGLGEEGRRLLAGVYAVTVAERAAGLAARAGWERSWIQPGQLVGLLGQAEALLQRDQSS